MIHESSMGNEEMPDYPGIHHWVDDLLFPYLRMTVATALYIGIPCYLFFHMEGAGAVMILSLVYLIIGMILFPMVFMRIAIYESFTGLEPITCVLNIIRTAKTYFVLWIFSFLVIGSPIVVLLDSINDDTDIVAQIVLAIVGFYGMCVVMNGMGKFFLENEDKFE